MEMGVGWGWGDRSDPPAHFPRSLGRPSPLSSPVTPSPPLEK